MRKANKHFCSTPFLEIVKQHTHTLNDGGGGDGAPFNYYVTKVFLVNDNNIQRNRRVDCLVLNGNIEITSMNDVRYTLKRY